ncbi:MAG TPA: hypothetical protein DDY78_29800 [Planctomycetales bacterium]|jgi:hypothetical protein|nr:hypothetical protein [Planctomycetales bacterium]
MSQTVRGFVVAALLTLGTLGGASAVRANDAPCCEYKTVVCYETHTVPCTETVTRYDECGHCYQAQVTSYHKVRVAVKKLVKVCY